MGNQKIDIAIEGKEKAKFFQHLLKDIECLELMLANGVIEKNPIRIGAEQEFCIVDNDWTPSLKGLEILELLNDEHFTTELALYNLEVNLDPLELKAGCFIEMMKRQLSFLQKANSICKSQSAKPLLSGILPSISGRHIEMEYMTPSPRYKVLNEVMKKLRGKDFNVSILGVDELKLMHNSVLFEACNTSYQMHLQIEPDDFVSSYNWAQAISGPLLSVCTNSPLLLGKELWSETRIALFQQSIDTRTSSHSVRYNEPRVTFGNAWIENSITDIYKDDISRFELIVNSTFEEDSIEILNGGRIPKLDALSLHSGTVYRWNRACYGVGDGKPHVRIENRYIPSGPSVTDEIANFVFWVGLMKGRPSEYDQIHKKMDFKDAKSNFIKAARTGKESFMKWMGTVVTSQELVIKTLLPIARLGLKKAGIGQDEMDYFLDVIEKRATGKNGSEWQVYNYRRLKKSIKKENALRLLCAEMYKNQQINKPVSEWENISVKEMRNSSTKPIYVYEIMTTELFTTNENNPLNLVSNMMRWKDIHHVPVEDSDNRLKGLLTWQLIDGIEPTDTTSLVKDIMVKDVIYVDKKTSIEEASNLMIRNNIGCLPVKNKGRLIGIITKKDLVD